MMCNGIGFASSCPRRTKPLTPIRLRMETDDGKIEVTYDGEEIAEKADTSADDILNEVLGILGGESVGVEEIHKALKERNVKVGINKLREILKVAKDKELTEDEGVRGKKLYRAASQLHEPYKAVNL